MEFILNPYALTLIFSSLLVGGLSIYIGLKLEDSVRWIAFTMLASSIWGFFYGVELTAQTLEDMLFWVKLQYIGLVLAPSCWLVFALKYTAYDTSKKPWLYPLIFILPFLTYLIVLTNSWHNLHYKDSWLIADGPFPILGIEKGIWYPVLVIYSYFFYFLGTLVLWNRFQYANIHFKLQTRLLIIGGFFPLVINVFYQLSWLKPFQGLDMTPFSFLFSYFLISIAILKFNLLNLKPVARDKILEAMTRGVLIFDNQNKIVDFNAASKNFCTQPDKIRIGQASELIFSQRPEIEKLIKERKNHTIESRIALDGEERILRVEAVQINDSKTLALGVLLLMDDITEQIKTNEQLKNQTVELQQLNDLKDKFFSIISHDLKGPVFGVKELIHLTQSGVISKEEFLDMLPEVSKNMEHVALLLENLLAWTSSQLRGEYLQPQVVDLAKLLNSQKNLLDRIAIEKSITIELHGFEDAWAFADKNMLELIVRNLISNALKFSNPDSKVLVTNEIHGDNLKLCVRDFGTGISEENLYKLNNGISFTTRGQANETGTGLGLVLVREYILKNGGTMTVDSKLGEGSKFCVTIPKAAESVTTLIT
ncbi:MAG: histidine kinase N-terminal 7TM domain-containing protein [Algoriphagus sp.]|uniref:sensor histidine kinase n=1 Tax=Algoriphagus sp. TaxID=1872435 RepID=UPI00272F0B46|nr:histidine kinase N-terminal 7TM domain-containing protein [Algoriphagus sp.]MDP2043151.1 histidine kinase N-terminal 7TM domain-containing protein [Algoriphagus sp.]MDP3470355.1 histidine kinase N-terminal 7TM domain-containing protein [Algoriphagus sp.]